MQEKITHAKSSFIKNTYEIHLFGVLFRIVHKEPPRYTTVCFVREQAFVLTGEYRGRNDSPTDSETFILVAEWESENRFLNGFARNREHKRFSNGKKLILLSL